jgi:hypothetical protein
MSRWPHAILPVCITLGLCGCAAEPKPAEEANRDPKDRRRDVDPHDPSIVYDTPFTMNTGRKTYNGKAYDRASLWIDPKARLVLPDKNTEVIRTDDPSTVVIYMEKRISHMSHHSGPDWWPIPSQRPNMGCAVKLEKGSLLVGTFGEFSHKEGSVRMRLVVDVPDKAEVIRKAGLIGDRENFAAADRSPKFINPAPDDPRPALTKKQEGRPEVWLPPVVEDGWHEIPAVADPKRRAEKD